MGISVAFFVSREARKRERSYFLVVGGCDGGFLFLFGLVFSSPFVTLRSPLTGVAESLGKVTLLLFRLNTVSKRI